MYKYACLQVQWNDQFVLNHVLQGREVVQIFLSAQSFYWRKWVKIHATKHKISQIGTKHCTGEYPPLSIVFAFILEI